MIVKSDKEVINEKEIVQSYEILYRFGRVQGVQMSHKFHLQVPNGNSLRVQMDEQGCCQSCNQNLDSI